MTTARDIIQDAVEKLGIYAPSEPLNDTDANRGFSVLQDLVSGWRSEQIFLYQLSPVVFQLNPGQQVYAIGSGAFELDSSPLGGPAPLGPSGGLVSPLVGQPYPSFSAPGAAATSSTTVATLQATTSAPLQYPIIQFAVVPTTVLSGQSVADLTNPAAIPLGARVLSVSGNAVTMTVGARGSGVQVGDMIQFGTTPMTVNVVSALVWDNLILPSGLASGQPDTVWFDGLYPSGSIHVSPIPTVAGTLVFRAVFAFDGFITLDQPDVMFTSGTRGALQFNLAVNYNSDFLPTPPPAEVAAKAITHKERLRFTNSLSRAAIPRYRSLTAQPRAA